MKNVAAWVVSFVAGMLLAGCTSNDAVREGDVTTISNPSQRSSSKYIQIEEKSGSYILKRGDQVELNIFGYPEFNTKAIVKEDGTITVPLAGDVQAEGVTKDKVSERLKTRLAEFIKGEIKMTVTVTSPVLKKITVLGAVNRQDNFPAREEMSLSEVLALAGGASLDSDLHRVKVTRGGRTDETLLIDMAESMDRGDMNSLPMIRPGDTVFIPKRENLVRDFSDFLRDAFFIFSFFRVVY